MDDLDDAVSLDIRADYCDVVDLDGKLAGVSRLALSERASSPDPIKKHEFERHFASILCQCARFKRVTS